MNPISHERALLLIQQQPHLPPEDQAALASHLAGCGECRLEAETFTRLAQALPRAFPPIPTSREISQGRIARAQQELRNHTMSTNRRSSARLAAGLIALAALVLVLSWAVRSLAPAPASEPTTTPTATPTITPAPFPGTPVSRSIYPPSSTPQEAFTPTPEATQTATPGEPLLSGESIRTNGWSPDGQWLAYWYAASHDPSNTVGPWPPARLQFSNPVTGLTCPHPEIVAFSYAPGTWTEAGEFLVAEGETFRAGVPCGEFRELTQSEYLDLLPPAAYDPALSISGTYRAETTILSRAEGVIQAETIFTEVASGREMLRLGWMRWDALGDLGLGGEWLDDTTFLVHQSLERGPLLVSLEGTPEVIEVAKDVFEVENAINPDPDNYTGWVAFGSAASSEGGAIHILLMGTGMEAAFPEIMLIHSEDGRVETLPYRYAYGTGFIPSGRPGLDEQAWLVLASSDFSSGFEQRAYHYREMEAVGEPFTYLGDTLYMSWRHESYTALDNLLALGWDDGRVRIQTFPGEQVISEYSTGNFSAVYLEWSPGGERLAVSGFSQRGVTPYMGLFIFEIP